MPVTTASGKLSGTAGDAEGSADGDEPEADGEATAVAAGGDGAGLTEVQPATMADASRSVVARKITTGIVGNMRSRRRRAAALLFGIALATALSVAAPRSASAVGPLPECRLDNIMTVPRDYDSWSTTLVDWLLRVPRNYKPPDLVPVGEAGIAGPGLIRAVAIDDLRAMTKAAARNGTPIAVNSPYRSYADQVASFNGWVAVDGYDDAITYSQRPGHSEHQLGLTIDFMTLGGGSALQGDWATTPSGKWMAENAWKYGWLMSYPKAKGGALFSDATCFHYEPWHYRYLGRDIARKVHRSGLTIREYLWKHYTMVDPETGEPLATPTPSSTPSATPSPSPTATVTALPSATPTNTPAPLTSAPLSGVSVGWPILAAAAIAVLLVILTSVAFVTRRRARQP
jgi:D-alanyl-D-alanine carboxypeptidase